ARNDVERPSPVVHSAIAAIIAQNFKESPMSWQPSNDPVLGDPMSCDALDLVIVPRTRDLGDGFAVRRALPHGKRQMVGPFIFFDHFGPMQFLAGKGMDVRPHPHIGRATFTYLFDGVIAGQSFGIASPVAMVSPWFYAEVSAEQGASVPLDPDHEERAIYIVEGEVEIANERYEGPRLLIFRPGDRITVKAVRLTRMMFLGGDALEGPRHIWWNFVSSSTERIEQAKQDWKTGRFAAVP